MNCPNPKCPYFLKHGKPYPRVSYKESRQNHWKGRLGDSAREGKEYEGRTNFQINPCSVCGFEGEI